MFTLGIEIPDDFVDVRTKDLELAYDDWSALFKTARIHFLTGEDSLATIEFSLIADHYPQPDLYDKAQMGLADILLRRTPYRESIEELQAMVFADPLYAEEEIELLKAEIL